MIQPRMARTHMARVGSSLIVLTAVVLFTFTASTRNDFVNFDDHNEIYQNPHLNPVTWRGLAWNWSNTELTLYMPVTYMVWGALASIAPRDLNHILQPAAFHALNLGLHLICTWLVYWLLMRLGNQSLPALIGALVFAVHPLQVEPVAWASGMYTVLSTAFSLAALIAFITHARDATRGGPIRFYWLATLFYVIALLSKAASVSVPLAAIVIDVLILRRPLAKSIRSMAFWILLGIPIVLLAKSFQDVSVISVPAIWTRPVVALDAFGFYLRKIVLPIHLIPDYGRNPNWVMHHPMPVAFSIAIAIISIWIAFVARRKAAWITAGFGLLLAGIGPYLGLTTFDFQYVSTVADRYAYFGMVGVALLAAGAAARYRLALLGLVIAVIVCMPISYTQAKHWHDTKTLFTYTLKVNPTSLVSHAVFGFIEARNSEYTKAQADYQAALDTWPEDALVHFNLANLLVKEADAFPARREKLLFDAIGHYSLAVHYQPHFIMYRNSLAAAYAQANDVDQARQQWNRVIILDPENIDARNNLADMLCNKGIDLNEAKSQYRTVLQIDPNNRHAAERLSELSRAMNPR